MRVLLLTLILIINLFSEDVLPPGNIRKMNATTINTLLIFTSQDGLNSGLYHFTNTEVDVDMEIYHLPFVYNIKSDTDLNYFLVGNIGYSRTSLAGTAQKLDAPATLNYLNHIQTYTAGIGGGIRYEIYDDIKLSTGVELIYSRSGASVKDSDSDFENAIEDFFNANHSDNISYKFFALGEYRPIFYEYKPYLTLSYKLYETKSDFSVDEILSFSSESSVATLSIGVETPQFFKFNKNSFSAEFYLNANYLSGIVSDVIKVNKYHSFGGVAYYNTPKTPWWASRFFLELNKAKGDGLDGYNVGLGFTLDF